MLTIPLWELTELKLLKSWPEWLRKSLAVILGLVIAIYFGLNPEINFYGVQITFPHDAFIAPLWEWVLFVFLLVCYGYWKARRSVKNSGRSESTQKTDTLSWSTGISDFQNAIRFNNSGLTNYGKADHDSAIADFTEAIKLDPRYASAYYNRSLAYEAKGERKRAKADYYQALTLNSKIESPIYFSLARSYHEKSEYDKAITEYTRVIEIEPEFTDIYLYRGSAYFDKGDYNHAIADFTEAIRRNPQSIDAYNGRGVAYRNKGDYDHAFADYNEAIRLDSKDSEAYNNRAYALFKLGRLTEALVAAQKSIDLNSNYAYPVGTRGCIFEALGRIDEAVRDYKRAVELDPTLTEAVDALKRLGVTK